MFDQRPQIDISSSSGILRVTMHPRARWYVLPVMFVVEVFVGYSVLREWATANILFRSIVVAGALGLLTATAFEFFVTQIIEFSAKQLSFCKEFHGWERRRSYAMEECSRLEWHSERGESQLSGLKCKVGWRTIQFAKGLSEEESSQIFAALQTYLPEVFRALCSTPKSEEHFITLGLKSSK
jgi:hypothetical protein